MKQRQIFIQCAWLVSKSRTWSRLWYVLLWLHLCASHFIIVAVIMLGIMCRWDLVVHVAVDGYSRIPGQLMVILGFQSILPVLTLIKQRPFCHTF